MNNIFNNKGFVLLYALLVAGIVLAIGMSLSGIISKQIQLSSIGKMSRIAYYAADSGRNCGMFWWKYGGTNISGADPDALVANSIIYEYRNPDDFKIYCSSSGAQVTNKTRSDRIDRIKSNFIRTYDIDPDYFPSNGRDFSFDIDFGDAGGSPACAKVTVISFPTNVPNYAGYKVITLSSGFSASCAKVNSPAGSKIVSRTLVTISQTEFP